MKLIKILLLFTAITACGNKQKDIIVPMKPSAPDTTAPANVTYLALGDSYTIGESVPQSSNFPHLLAAQLNNSAAIKVAEPQIIARTGWTTDELMAAIKERNPQGPYDVVTLLIGVNNQYRGYKIDTYRTQFVALLNMAIEFAGNDKKKVFVLSIPDYSVTPFASSSNREKIAQEIDAYNAINREETLKAGVDYTDITPISRMAATDADLIAGDGLHPSAKMYAEWMQLLAPKVASQIKASR